MDKDLIERLRDHDSTCWVKTMSEAADEIERLEARELEQSCQIERHLERERYLEAKVAKLEAAMRKAANERYFNAALQVLADALATTEQGESDDGI